MTPSGSQCPFCQGSALKRFTAHAHDAPELSLRKVNITECTQCVAAWQWPFHRTPEESAAEFETAYTTQIEESYFDPAKRTAIGELQQQFVAAHTARPGKLLDIGCGDGCFARIMASHGWEVTGLDPALPSSALQSSQSDTAKLIRGTFSDLPEHEQYDVITVWDVVEHVENPFGLITEIASRIAPGGLLVVETGNYQSAGRITAGSHWWNYQLDHRWYLAPSQLKQMLFRVGLSDLRLADRVLRPWWKGQVAMSRPHLFSLAKSIIKHPFHAPKTLQTHLQLVEGYSAWGAWGGLEIMTVTGRRTQ